MLTLEEKLNHLPQKPGVYRFLNEDGQVLYVGKAQNLRSRVRQYFHASRVSDPRIDAMVKKIRDLEITVTDTEVEALILEANLIKELKPRYNVVLKDDKSYPYIVITDEEFPRVFVTRRRLPGNARYFGPYTDVRTMRAALKTVRSVFMIRSCNFDLTEKTIAEGKFKLCLDYHIKKCGGPCEGLVRRDEYRAMIEQVANVLRGKTREVQQFLTAEMQRKADELRFEEAAQYRDKIQQLKVYEERQKIVETTERDRDIFALAREGKDACCVMFREREGKIVGSRHFYLVQSEEQKNEELMEHVIERYYLETDDYPEEILISDELPSRTLIEEWLHKSAGHPVNVSLPRNATDKKLLTLVQTNAEYWLKEFLLQRTQWSASIPESVKALQQALALPQPPRRIDCFDVSTLQGTDTVASMVVFMDGKPRKSEYRKFAIRTVEGQDDFASIREVVERRYSKVTEETRPDLIVIDGGKGQLSSAYEVLNSLQLSIPVIGLAKRLEEIFVPSQSEPLLLAKTSPALRLLQRIRDEAHRFAVEYHRVVRSKRILQTELDLVRGIGAKRAKELLEVFGSVQGIRFASEEQLADVVGPKLAARLRAYFETEDDTPSDAEKSKN